MVPTPGWCLLIATALAQLVHEALGPSDPYERVTQPARSGLVALKVTGLGRALAEIRFPGPAT